MEDILDKIESRVLAECNTNRLKEHRDCNYCHLCFDCKYYTKETGIDLCEFLDLELEKKIMKRRNVMYSLNDFKVTLLNKEEVKNFIKNHGVIACICYDTPEKYAERVGLSCLKEGHTSGSRGDFFKFEIECPRFTADQIMRHEQGVFKNCQSQRYVDMDDNFEIYAPPRVMHDEKLCKEYERYEEQCKAHYKVLRACYDDYGVSGEAANDLMRTMLPIGVKTKLRIGFTIEALIHFMEKRLCTRADLPIRTIANMMKEEVLKVEPRYEELFQPQCKKLMYCPEKHSCHMYPTRMEIEDVIELGYQKLIELRDTDEK